MEEQNGIPNINQAEVNIGTGINGGEVKAGGIGTTGEEYANASQTVTDGTNSQNNITSNKTKTETTDEKQGSNWSKASLPTKVGFWGKLKAFFLQEITVELTPKQKKIEKEINDFLFQEIRFGKKKKA